MLCITAGICYTVPTALDLKLMKQVTTNLSTNDAIAPFVMSTLMTQVWLATNGTTRAEVRLPPSSKKGSIHFSKMTQ